ncbi:class I SAM-dependent methyltransferase [Mesobacillus harenae]|uniref:class I SAM-dependent methyltransferase n=1 Tax=Mesobacillus harenae TaxID=2213203 RepID=UPI00158075BA|nr:class I SAM-dependent methyltransferase [Mesobacillus harenae]
MKYRDSGMPEQTVWDTFFNAEQTLELLEVSHNIKNLVDIGCGYGTFLLPASKIISGTAIGIDIDQHHLKICQNQIKNTGAQNIHLINGDISEEETIKAISTRVKEVDYITLFNILHCEEPLKLLENAYDLLKPGGQIGVIHWIHGDTGRGPSLEIRPKPEAIIKWANTAGLTLLKQAALPPFHFGLVFKK